MNWLKVDITTIANGGVNQLFNQELEEIMRNIRDINMEHKPTRRITLQFDFAADEDRTNITCKFRPIRKVAPMRAVKSTMVLTEENGQLQAHTLDIEQPGLFTPNSGPQGLVVVGGIVTGGK